MKLLCTVKDMMPVSTVWKHGGPGCYVDSANISPSAACRWRSSSEVKWGPVACQNHIRSTEQEDNEACIHRIYSIIILNIYILLSSLINVQFSKITLKCVRHVRNKQVVVHIHHIVYSMFNMKPPGWLVLLNVRHLVPDNKFMYFINHNKPSGLFWILC